MNLRRALYILFSFQLVYKLANCLTCLSCDSITQPRHCHYVARCKSDEVCGTEKLFTKAGYYSYKLSCVSKTNCPNGTTTNGPLCKECCNGDLCNAGQCGEPDYPATRGPICYDCQFHTEQQQCRRIDFCAIDEVCSVNAAEEFGEMTLSSGCKRKHLCPGKRSAVQTPVVGKRSLPSLRSASRPVCESCCSQDLCNLNCSTIDYCATSSCKHGTCVSANTTTTCTCSPGWAGHRCDEVDPCSLVSCGIGTCQLTASSTSCVCSTGWSGSKCDVSTFDCDFELGLCTWTQGTTDDFSWTRNSGSTGSSNTGPLGDHTTGSGYYMYIEASSPRRNGDTADLVSELLAPGHIYCMELAMNMYGNHMGDINIYIKHERKTRFLIKHFKQKKNLQTWSVQNVTVKAQPHKFNIIIEGVRGVGIEGDAAIDDVRLIPGVC